MVERPSLVTQSEVVFIVGHAVPHAKPRAIEGDRIVGALLRDDLACVIDKGDPKGSFVDPDCQQVRSQLDRGVCF